MPYYIKFINEDKQEHYSNFEAVSNIIYYIYGGVKSIYDSIRPGHAIGEFNGCIPFLGPEWMSHDHDQAISLIKLNSRIYGYDNSDIDFIKHRIISFNQDEYLLPKDADSLARFIINSLYREYITVYGVHLDTKQIHIHIGVHTINIYNGNKFSIPFEKNRLMNLIDKWLDEFNKKLDNEINGIQKYERYLFNE